MNYKLLANVRRLSQIGFLLFFCLLLLRTGIDASTHAAGPDARLAYPVRFFFEIDPLAALANALGSHALYRGLLWALVVVIPTLFFGRFFCGWVCPMGTIHHYFGRVKSESKRGKLRISSNRYKPWQTTKYYILFALLAATALGSALVGWLDPFSVLVRSLGLSVIPALNYGLGALARGLEQSDYAALQTVGGALHAAFAATVLDFHQPYFRQGVYLGLIFLAIVTLNLRVTRFWCRALCPLGALLGITSRWSILGLSKNAQTCNDCNRCLMQCQGGDDPVGPWHKTECLLCLNCVASCPRHSLSFGLFPETAMVEGPNLQRRRALVGVAAGVAAIPLLRSTTGFAADKSERLLRPPGSLAESDFLQRCLRCGECMKACPNNALHPAIAEAGLEGLWTPVLVPHIGYCEPSCVLCSQVCPTGAIWEITPQEKGWVGDAAGNAKPIRLGTAFYDRGRCLPWAMAVDCIVCQEWCPTSPKAIYLQEAEVVDSRGNKKTVKQPYIDPAQCIGCGCCEFACVLQDRPAVYITSVGESRSPANQLLLK